MTVAERIRMIQLYEKVKANGEKQNDGSYVVKDTNGNVIMKAEMKAK